MRQLFAIYSAALLLGLAGRSAAQTTPADTTRLSYGEELTTPPPAAGPLRVQPAPRGLWKLGLNNFLPYSGAFGEGTYYTRYGLHLAYEHRLRTPAWTVLGEVSPALTRYRPDATAETQPRLAGRAQVAGRYYYNRERRLLLGKNVGNFSANYLSVALGAGLGRTAHETPFFLYRNRDRQFATADAALLYGLQRRLGRRGFVDANVGVAMLLLAGQPIAGLTSSLRLGLTLGPQSAPYARRPVPADVVVTLRPRFYVGAEIGGNFYRVRYSVQTPYPPFLRSQRAPRPPNHHLPRHLWRRLRHVCAVPVGGADTLPVRGLLPGPAPGRAARVSVRREPQ